MQGFYPSGDHLVDAKRSGLSTLDGAVEQGSVYQRTFVVALYLVSSFGIVAYVAFLDDLVLQAAGQCDYAGAFAVLFQELLSGFDVCRVHLLLHFFEVFVHDVACFRMADGCLVAFQHIFDGLCEVFYYDAFGTHAP